MTKALCIILAAVLLSACGGGGGDEDPLGPLGMTADERGALALQCLGHGAVMPGVRLVIVLEADGNHHYLRGTCSDGTAVQTERLR